VKVGIHLPQWGPAATRDGVLASARAAEACGLDSIWVADHVVVPLRYESVYPYGRGGAPFAPDDGFLEALVELAAVAGATERIALGTSVLVAPMREPLLLAKQVATLDVLAGGRALFGVGVGWWAEEFAALGAPFAGRGRRLDEQLRVLRRLWRDGVAAWDGELFSFDEIACEPRPVQAGGPPIWIGGTGPRAWRRAATLADGWHGIGFDLDDIAAGSEAVAAFARDAGRDPAEISISRSIGLPAERDAAFERLLALKDAGVAHAVLNLRAYTHSEFVEMIESLVAELVSQLRG
jgi:probable F420-dependent oxidoreductase